MLLVTIGLGLFEIGSVAVGFAHGRGVTFQGSVQAQSENALPRFVDQPGVVDVTVHIHHASAKQQALTATRDLPPIVMVAIGLWLLRALLVSVRTGDPFNDRNVSRLRGIAALMILVPFVDIGQHYIDNALAGSVPGLTEWPNGHGLSLTGPVAGLVVLALAQVFAYGVRLREDVEGTV